MFNTPRKSNESKTYGIPIKVQLKGLFQDGIWHCNCKPRLPAAHFLVRKEGPNKGRWFYTCQEPKESGCGFFLWGEDATGREMMAVISNSRSEPAATLEPLKDWENDDKRTVEGHIEASNKWMAELAKREEEEFGEWPLSVNGENSLTDTAEERIFAKPRNLAPETPRKAVKVDMLSTPGSKRKRDNVEAWPTPNTGRNDSDDVFTTPSITKPKGGMWNGNERSGIISPSVTPTPARFRDVNQTAEAIEGISDLKDYDITKEVMEILKEQSLDEEVSTKLRLALNRHALRTQGVARGRDITRLALKTKEGKISELEQRIVELQNERELDKIIIKHFKSDMAQSLNNRGRGRGRPNE